MFHVKHFRLWIRSVDNMATIIDGKTIAKRIRDEIARKVEQIKKGRGFAPKLTVIFNF